MTFRRKIVRIFAGMTIGILAFTGCSKAKTEEEKYVDLKEYYGITAQGNYGIIVDGNAVGQAVRVEDKVYLPQTVVADEINSKFYYDKENKKIRYTMPNQVVEAEADASDKRVITYNDEIYLELTYVMYNSKVKYSVEENPDRIVVFTQMGATDTYKTKDSEKLRKEASSGSEIMTDLAGGQILYKCTYVVPYGNTLSEGETEKSEWIEVMTETGIKGYVPADILAEAEAVNMQPDREQPEYTHITMDKKVCLGWQLMTNKSGNNDINDKIKNAEGLNVISPTWFTVADGMGEITSLASKEYVKTAHDKGIQVWALANDFNTDENGKSFVLQAISSTKSRTNLINNLVSEAEKYDIDGINIDFEKISLDYAKDYVQFIRELSIECRKKGIILSADLYVPMSYNQYYGREEIGEVLDYIIIMGYDEHWAGCDSAGSVASISYVKNGINNTIKTVDASRVINAIPFYTRIWSETPEDVSDGSGLFVEDYVNGNYYLASKAVGMSSAEYALTSRGIEKYWLEDIGQYYGEYTENGILYRVWLEEERSIALKLEAMDNVGLAGVACWQLGFEKKEIWEVIGEYLNQ